MYWKVTVLLKYGILIISALLVAKSSYCQFNISGRVWDSETNEPLQFAHVFLDQTTHGTVTNEKGEYLLSGIEPGEYKLVFSFVGYDIYQRQISIYNKDVAVNTRLVPHNSLLQDVEVKGTKDKEWERHLKEFTKLFLGENQFAKDCKILNPWFIDFEKNKATGDFNAVASQPIQIENKALGYFIECTLQIFQVNSKGYRIKGLYNFRELEANDDVEATRWTNNRKKAYLNSLRFLFKSIIDRNETSNGFDVYFDMRPEEQLMKLNSFAEDLGKVVFKPKSNELVRPYTTTGVYKVIVQNKMEIHHTTSYAQLKFYRDMPYPVSWIELEKGFVLVNKEGVIFNVEDITTIGEFNKNRVADMLPHNYKPDRMVVVKYLTKINAALRMQEHLYLHTDKAFYESDEKIKYKLYQSIASPSLRDSLSGVAYIELIDAEKTRKVFYKIKLRDAQAQGELSLPSDFTPGLYYLRAYTNWMRNYGDENVFITPIYISAPNQFVYSLKKEVAGGNFNVTLPMTDVLASQNFSIGIQLDSLQEDSLANASISVAPASVACFPGVTGTKESLASYTELPEGMQLDFPYPIEYNLSVEAHFNHPKKKHVPVEITVLESGMKGVYNVKTNRKGYFTIDDLDFYDSLDLGFQGRDKKGRIIGSTEIISKNHPEIILPNVELNSIDSIRDESSGNKKKQSTSRPVDAEETNRPVKSVSSSFADFVITRDELDRLPDNLGILNAMQQLVPGFRVNMSTGKISLGGSNLTNSADPLIVIDGLPINITSLKEKKSSARENSSVNTQSTNANPNQTGDVSRDVQSQSPNQVVQSNQPLQNNFDAASEDVPDVSYLSSISYLTVDNVARIEVNKSYMPGYGNQGAGGVINIYTRKSMGKSNQVKTFDVYRIQGYSNKPDTTFSNNSNLVPYWNPKIELTKRVKVLTLKAPEKTGLYLIKLVALTEQGKALQGIYYLQVK